MAAEQYHKHQRLNSPLELNTAQNNKLMAPSKKGWLSYLDCLQKLTTSSLDVFKRTSLGQHEEMSQDLVQVAVGGASESWGGQGSGWDGLDDLYFLHEHLPDVLHGFRSGGGISAAQSIPSPQGLLFLHFHVLMQHFCCLTTGYTTTEYSLENDTILPILHLPWNIS